MEPQENTQKTIVTFKASDDEDETSNINPQNEETKSIEEKPSIDVISSKEKPVSHAILTDEKPMDDNTSEDESNTEAREMESATSRLPSAILLEMDKKYSWLDEIPEKYEGLESIMTRTQYVAVCNYFQNYIDYLQSKTEEMPGVHGEFRNLFEKFRTCFAGGQRLQNKIFELMSLKQLTESHNKKLKTNLQKEQIKLKETTDQLEQARQSVIEMDKEKMALQHQINFLKEELTQHLEEQVI